MKNVVHMIRNSKKVSVLFAGIVASLAIAVSAHGAVVFDFTPSGTGGTIVTGTGSGTSTADTTSSDFDAQDFNTDFLQDTFTSSIVPETTVSGTLTNITAGVSETINGFRVDRDTTSGDDIDFQTVNAITFATGDQFSLTLNATFDLAALPFAQLVPGTHTEDGGEFADENFGQYTVNVVPEPSSMVFASICFAAVVAGRRRRHI